MSSSIKFSLVPSESNNSVMLCFNLESAKLKNSMGCQEYIISLNMLLKKKQTQAGKRAKHSAKCRVLRRQPNTNWNIKGWCIVDRRGLTFLAKVLRLRQRETHWRTTFAQNARLRISYICSTPTIYIFPFVNAAFKLILDKTQTLTEFPWLINLIKASMTLLRFLNIKKKFQYATSSVRILDIKQRIILLLASFLHTTQKYCKDKIWKCYAKSGHSAYLPLLLFCPR